MSDGLNQGEMLHSTHPCVLGSSRGTACFTPEAFSPDTGTCPYLLPTPIDEGSGLLTENCLHLTACEVQTELGVEVCLFNVEEKSNCEIHTFRLTGRWPAGTYSHPYGEPLQPLTHSQQAPGDPRQGKGGEACAAT